jgi:hypothetical protein
MNIQSVQKKLREAKFFLEKLREHEDRAFGDKEPFDFYLSAFLSAANSILERFKRMNRPAEVQFRKKWDRSLTPRESKLMSFLKGQRDKEVHASGTQPAQRDLKVPVGRGYSDPSGIVYVTDPEGSDRGAVVSKPAYYFTIDSVEQERRTRAPTIWSWSSAC